MAEITLVTGGCRSGKSRYAQTRAEALADKRTFVATCPPVDAEMEERIRRHRQERQGRGWETIEEPVALAQVLRTAPPGILLVDCLTLWVGNLLHAAEEAGHILLEDEVAQRSAELLESCQSQQGRVFFVTNEVGMGIVPDNAAARRFRDLLGRCNQVIAAGADEVVLLVSGIAMRVK